MRRRPPDPPVHDPAEFRKLMGDGSFGGVYEHSDEDMLRVWQAGGGGGGALRGDGLGALYSARHTNASPMTAANSSRAIPNRASPKSVLLLACSGVGSLGGK